MSSNEEHGAGTGAVDSVAAQRAIGNEHLKLQELIASTEHALSLGEADPQVVRLAGELRDAVEAHFEREESLYYPTLWALRPSVESALKTLVDIHRDFCVRLGSLVKTLERGEVLQAARQLEDFSALFGEHERAEERILASLLEAS